MKWRDGFALESATALGTAERMQPARQTIVLFTTESTIYVPIDANRMAISLQYIEMPRRSANWPPYHALLATVKAHYR